MQVHIINGQGVYQDTIDISPYAPQPIGAIYEPVPSTGEDEIAVWGVDGWEVMNQSDAPIETEVRAVTPAAAACTRRQARLALLQLGLLAQAEQAIAAIADEEQRMAAQIEYEADTWERGNPFLQGLWASLGGTPEGLDDAFRLAVTL